MPTWCKLIPGNCLDVLPTLPDKSVDLVLTSPPHWISKEVVIPRKRNLGKFGGSDIILNFVEWDKFSDLKSFFNFTFKRVDECVRILRKSGMFISYFDRDKINFLSRYLQKS